MSGKFTEQEGRKDEAAALDGDALFLGVNLKLAPEKLGPGWVAWAVNKTMREGDCGTRAGTVTPAALQWAGSEIFGAGIFSDPLGVEWILLATAEGVWQVRWDRTARLIATPAAAGLSSADAGTCRFLQVFTSVVLLRGEGKTRWIWDGRRTSAFVEAGQDVLEDGTAPLPGSAVAATAGNRIWAPHERSLLAAGDLLSLERYDPATADFYIDSENDDAIVAVVRERGGLLVFKDQSVHRLLNVGGDLSQVSLEEVNGELGCVAPESVARVGADVFFLAATGVYRVMQVDEQRLATGAVAVSDPIEKVFAGRFGPVSLGKACAAVLEDYYYLAVGLDSERPNIVLPYNTVNGAWEGMHVWPDGVCFDDLLVTDYLGAKRLVAVDRVAMKVHVLYEGLTDIMGASGAAESQVADELVTRGYALGSASSGLTRFDGVRLDWDGWHPALEVAVVTPGVNGAEVLRTVSTDRMRYKVFDKADWDATNAADDHGAADREDYSLACPVKCGSGVALSLEQAHETPARVRTRARFMQVRVRGTRGRVRVRGVTVSGTGAGKAEAPR